MTDATSQATVSAPDFSSFSIEDLQGALATGNLDGLSAPATEASSTPAGVPTDQGGASEDPAGAVNEAAPPAGTPSTEPASTMDAAAEQSKEEAAASAQDDAASADDDATAPAFMFTEDASDEVFAEERAKWEEAYEVDPATKFLLERQDKTIADLQTQLQASQATEVPELYTKAVAALDALVTRVQDPHTLDTVPNTGPIVEFLQNSFPNELPELAESFLSMPSNKYQGITLFQQYLRDYGNLDEQGLLTVQQILDNGGRVPTPSFVPQGIDPQVAEAFWQAPNREQILAAVEAQYELMQDPMTSPDERQAARNYIQQVNQSLHQVQYGIDARIKAQEQVRNQQIQQRQQVMQAGDTAYAETTAALTRSFAEHLASNLDMFDAPAARVTALAYGNLIVNALADDVWAPHAQADLAKEGINFNWAEGRKALERLRNAEHNIAGHVHTKASPAAIEIAKKEKAAALKEVKRLELDLMGKISKVAVLGASRVLEGKVAAAPKTPAARPRATVAATAGAANAVPSTSNDLTTYQDLSIEELQSRIGKMKAEAGIRL